MRPGLFIGQSTSHTPRLSYDLRQGGFALQAVHMLDIGRVGLGLGLSAGALFLQQRFSDDQPDRTATGFSFGGVALATFALGGGTSLALTAEAGTYTFPFTERVTAPLGDGELESLFTVKSAALLQYTF